MATQGGKRFIMHRVEDDSGLNATLTHERKRNGEQRNAGRVIAGAVERVENPESAMVLVVCVASLVEQPRLLLQASGLALAVLMTWVWILGAVGSIGPGIVLGWWLAWSAYEMVLRMRFKPYVKDGPWWERNLRPASWADMASYVGFKNLLIAAAMFVMMKTTGVLEFLQGIQSLQWLY